jgi:hypothetical protein
MSTVDTSASNKRPGFGGVVALVDAFQRRSS